MSSSEFGNRIAAPFDAALALAFSNAADDQGVVGNAMEDNRIAEQEFLGGLEADMALTIPRVDDRLTSVRLASLREAMRWRGMRVMSEQHSL